MRNGAQPEQQKRDSIILPNSPITFNESEARKHETPRFDR